MQRLATLWEPRGSKYADGLGYPTHAAAEAFVVKHPHWYPNGFGIYEVEYILPDDAIWEGDEVELDICFGERWYDALPGIARVCLVNIRRGEVHGVIVNLYGEVLQPVLLREGYSSHPYRNLRRRHRDDQLT